MRTAFLRGLAALVAVTISAALPSVSAAEMLSEMLNQRILEAQRAEQERLFELALTNYAKALSMTGDTPQAERMLLRKRASLYEQIKMFDKAEADLTAAFKVEPFDPKVFIDRGYFYMRQGRFKEALDDFVAGSRADPKDASFLYGAARVLVASKDDTNAVKFYNEAMLVAPRDVKILMGRAEAYLRMHKYQDAAGDYDQAMSIGLKDREQRYYAALGRGYASMMMADFGQAVRFFNRTLELAPDASNVMLLRGYAYERQGARDLALRDYERAAAGMVDLAEARQGVARLRAGILNGGSVANSGNSNNGAVSASR